MDTNAERVNRLRLVLDENDDPEEYNDDEFPDPSPITQAKQRRKSVVGTNKQRKASKPRRRRRSSARFLRLGPSNGSGSGSNMNEDGVQVDFEEEFPDAADDDDLGAMYQKAIRMNAENRINATNSWNLSLIDHLDRFLSIPSSSNSQASIHSSRQNSTTSNDSSGGADGLVNFTRASCTLDASVKIYSYRVDDVHLTSYKVLANLNRTETSKKGGSGGTSGIGMDGHDNDKNESEAENSRRQKTSSHEGGNTETLEQNIGM